MGKSRIEAQIDTKDWWPCACVQRRKGRMTKIKLHHPENQACRVCRSKRPTSSEWKQAADAVGQP